MTIVPGRKPHWPTSSWFADSSRSWMTTPRLREPHPPRSSGHRTKWIHHRPHMRRSRFQTGASSDDELGRAIGPTIVATGVEEVIARTVEVLRSATTIVAAANAKSAGARRFANTAANEAPARNAVDQRSVRMTVNGVTARSAEARRYVNTVDAGANARSAAALPSVRMDASESGARNAWG